MDNRNMKGEWLVIFFYKLIFGRWIYERIMTDYNIFRVRANHYFHGRDNFINLDIEAEGDEGWKKLSDFLGIDLTPKWSNRQTEKVMADWLKLAVEKSEKKAAGANMTYPMFPSTGWKSKLLNRIHRILIRDFVHERHLFRNIGMAFKNRSSFSPKAYALAISHIGKFMRLIFCLMVRIGLVKDRQFCPYIF